ncbi:MAG TPA: hypothetical protein VIA18_02245 [Polyangia bacterium]|jgi:hypothetical protein|nr:hypothetical protein [Polyangia bacterium]
MMLVAPGCGDDTTSVTTTNQDLSATADMTMTAVKDMTVQPAKTCLAALNCVSNTCLNLTPITAAEACATQCGASLPTDQATAFGNLFQCVVEFAVTDAGFDKADIATILAQDCGKQYLACQGIGLDQ